MDGAVAYQYSFADPLRSLPIRIKGGALGENLPQRDLLVWPDHALFIGGVLIQAGALVNGVSLIRDAGVPEQFTDYHVELATHELLLAEGAATESFVDNVDRMHFSNWAEYEAPGGTVPIKEMDYPRAKAYLQVPMHVRRMLDARAMAFTGCQGGYLIPADAQVQRAIRSLDSGTRTHRPCWRRPITGLIGYFCPGLNV
jgi:hypothetical protein